MFGRMIVSPVVQVDTGVELQTVALIKVTENVEIFRWIELPASILLFLLVPGDPESGAVYVLDRKNGTWYSVDFEDKQLGGYSVARFENFLEDCKFLDLIERPRFWRTGFALGGSACKGARDGRLTEKIFQVIYSHPHTETLFDKAKKYRRWACWSGKGTKADDRL